MNKASFYFYRHRIFYFLTHPLFYICAIVFNLFCSGSFFLTGRFFSNLSDTSLNSYFNLLPYISIFIIPLLCLDPFSNYEISLPFSKFSRELIKLFAILTEFCLILVSSLLVPFCVNLFGNVEGAEVFTGLFFIILFASSSIALCLFFRSVFENQLLAFLFSVVFNVLFSTVHLFVSSFSSSAVLSKIFKSISFSWHFDSAQKGIFDSRDFVFFIAFTVLFLFLNIYTNDKKQNRHFTNRQKTDILWIFLILIFGFLCGQRYYFRKDFTERKIYSLTEFSKNILKENSRKINITYYRNRELESLYPSVKDVSELLNEYARDKNVSFQAFDPVRKNDVQLLSNYEIYPRQIQQSRNGKTELVNVYSCLILEMNGKIETVPFILSAKNLEFLITEKLLKLSDGQKRYVNILSGSGGNISEDYSYMTQFLNAQGFSVNIIDNTQDIKTQLEYAKDYGSLLMVMGSSALTDGEVQAIETYLESGKRVFFAVSPYEKDINETWRITKPQNQKLIRLIESYGFKFSKNLVKDLSSARILMQDENNNSTYINYSLWPELRPQENAKRGMTLFWPVSLENLSAYAFPVLRSSVYSCEVSPDEKSADSLFQTNPFLVSEEGFSSAKKDTAFVLGSIFDGPAYGYYNPGIFDSIKFEVVSDQYFCSSLMLGYIGGEYGDYRNLDFLTEELFKLNGEEGLASLYEKCLDISGGFFKTPDEESFVRSRNFTFGVNFILVPVLYILFYLIMIFVRKYKK